MFASQHPSKPEPTFKKHSEPMSKASSTYASIIPQPLARDRRQKTELSNALGLAKLISAAANKRELASNKAEVLGQRPSVTPRYLMVESCGVMQGYLFYMECET